LKSPTHKIIFYTTTRDDKELCVPFRSRELFEHC